MLQKASTLAQYRSSHRQNHTLITSHQNNKTSENIGKPTSHYSLKQLNVIKTCMAVGKCCFRSYENNKL